MGSKDRFTAGVQDSAGQLAKTCNERNRLYAEALRLGDRVKAGGWDFKVKILREHFDSSPRSTGSHVQEDLYELSVMSLGRMEYKVGGSAVEIDASRGDWVLIPSGLMHCRTCLEPPTVIFGYLISLECPPDGRWSKARLDREIERRGFGFPGSPALSSLLSTILEESAASLPLKAERLSLLVRDLLLCFLREAFPSSLDEPAGSGDPAAAALGLIRSFIEENVARDISLSEVASACGLSPRHANRVFSDAYGVSIGRHALERRMALARRRVEESSLQIKDVAIGLGYEDVSYFNRVFKRQFGMTPLECRSAKAEGLV